MQPVNSPNNPLPDDFSTEIAVPEKRRVTVGRIGLVFSCVALSALAAILLLRPG